MALETAVKITKTNQGSSQSLPCDTSSGIDPLRLNT